ncbi:MAG TPA: ROK family protein [Anaerolineaceae bacterium]|nr:ROK family protein [Anaerolineaceae bacterium]HNZ01251.1 ROK family protein [Anaerolineaceae bacterium]HOH20465.1 ROK family protein [Anaerolineaceae bacterium]HPA33934.1 ROK family protein [Anaerolineaceae bacterium]HQL38362.1 ROK family protein [Anaerolineaceae bacterium]
MTKPVLYGGIEGGGTKFVCAVGTGPEDIQAEIRFPTTTPAETMERTIDFFRQYPEISAIGLACFGPLDPNPLSPTYGQILPTPKPGWTGANLVGMLKQAFHLPVGFDTDVNGAALGEYHWGNGRGLDVFMYLTVGTGIGGGVFVNGSLLHGMIHPEAGHLPMPHDLVRDPFPGICPFHQDCFEGLATGVAMEKRWGQPAATLPPDHPAWDLEAHYIAHAMTSYIYILSPQRIILGGGVGQRDDILKLVQEKTRAYLNGYVQSPAVLEHMDAYIVHPGLGNRSGVVGALALAQQALIQSGE